MFPLCKSFTKNILYCLNVIAAVLIATVSLSFGTFTGLIDALRSKRVRREHHYTMCQSLHLKIWFFLSAVKLIKELLLMSWHITSASSFSLALLGRHSFYTPLTFDPLMCNNCVYKFLISFYFSFSSFLKHCTLLLSFFPFCFVLVDSVRKMSIYTHLDPYSLDRLLICDNMSSMPSEHNNLIVHAASVTLSYRAGPGRGTDSDGVRERYSR